MVYWQMFLPPSPTPPSSTSAEQTSSNSMYAVSICREIEKRKGVRMRDKKG